MEQCDAARQSIRVGMRGVSREVLDLLAEKARQGVGVRVLADGLESRGSIAARAAAIRLERQADHLFNEE